MKKINIFLGASIMFLFFTIQVFAQLRTDSKSVTTKVGTPSGSVASCPIPNGIITCGSKAVPIDGCGHCGLGYDAYMTNCTYPGIYYAMDIAGSDFQDVILPSVNGAIISWVFVTQTNEIQPPTSQAPQAIQDYSGTDTTTGDKYWIQFHHTAPGSGGGNHSSGEVGAKICGNGCGMGHVHVEFAKVTPNGNEWQDAPNYFCK